MAQSEGKRFAADEFSAWVAPHLTVMANLAARMVGLTDRDDVVQESMSRAWRRFETFDGSRGTARGWLLAIVADRARRHNRRHLRGAFTSAPDAPVESGRDDEVLAAVAKLPGRQRVAVELYYFVDLSVAEVAELMGCSEGTVKSSLHDARTRLRRELETNA